jgi:hypothetical protein
MVCEELARMEPTCDLNEDLSCPNAVERNRIRTIKPGYFNSLIG